MWVQSKTALKGFGDPLQVSRFKKLKEIFCIFLWITWLIKIVYYGATRGFLETPS
jgi:hypothetical protein